MPPPDTLTDVQHSRVVVVGGAAPVNPLAKNPRRNYLYIRNNGLNAGAFWFDQAIDTGQSIVLGPLASWEPRAGAKVPIDRVFFQSAAGTTFGVIEGTAYSLAGGGAGARAGGG